ncbi:S66 peptidase family protein [Flavobacterium columnare]|uniref:S66 family peptidase n=1 Tax=Flavobacterium columnare TaxID=996 RepID=UPI0013D8CB88|nr:S66 peptidase family protein [Flavobacterium columnare]
MNLIKPKLLKKGDKVATISLSWGGAGEIPYRYEQGKRQIQEVFGLEVVETKNALKPAKWIYENPQERANDLMEAFKDTSIKAIISNIGGEDSIRILRYIDIEIIKNNPKIFIGFSDSTIIHFLCLKAGLSSFYGTSTLVGFAENGGMHQYQIDDLKKTLFSKNPIGEILPNKEGWTSERLEWFDQSLLHTKRKLEQNLGWNFLQGKGIVRGKLIGGCLEVLERLKGTVYWPELDKFENAILFLETSEVMPRPEYIRYSLRNYAELGILKALKGIIVGRPYHNEFVSEYDNEIKKILLEEKLTDLPVITQMDFGHTCPTFTIPFGVEAEIDCVNKKIKILESGVIE